MRIRNRRSLPQRRSSALVAAAVSVFGFQGVSPAKIVSSEDTKPGFLLYDTIGSTHNFTVPTDGSTHGGVYVGDVSAGTLTIDNTDQLHSTFGIVANGPNSGSPDGSRLNISGGGAWYMTEDMEFGNRATAIGNVTGGSTLQARAIRMGTESTASAILQVQAYSNLTATQGGLTVGFNGTAQLVVGIASVSAPFMEIGTNVTGFGTVDLSASTLSVPNAGISVGLNGRGTLTAGGGSVITSEFTNLGIDYGNLTAKSTNAISQGTVFLSGNTTQWNNDSGFGIGYNTKGAATIFSLAELHSGFVEVGRYGQATLDVDNASVLAAPTTAVNISSVIFGTETGSVANGTWSGNAIVSVSGTGGFIEIGRNGTATLNVESGTGIDSDIAILGTEAPSTATVNVSGESTFWVAYSTFEAGRNGDVTLNVSGGAEIFSDGAFVSVGAASTSAVTITGAGSHWDTTNRFVLARNGHGTVNVTSGGAIHGSELLSMAEEAGSSAALNLSGSATVPDPAHPGQMIVVPSEVTSAAQIIVGGSGSASVTIAGGAHLDSNKASSPTASSGIIARFAGSTGLVNITGAGSSWTQDGVLNVGFGGAGTLNVLAGASVASPVGVLARNPGSVGTATVDGAGSLWNIGTDLYIGGVNETPGGNGTLKVQNQGAVTVGGATRIFPGSSLQISAGGSFTSSSTVNDGSITLDTPGAVSFGTLTGAGSLTVTAGTLTAKSITQPSLTISGNSTVQVLPNGTAASASSLQTLSIIGNGKLDLTNNALLVTTTSGTAATLRNYVKSAYHNGKWDLPGLTSSTAASPADRGATVLAVADNAVLHKTLFAGQSIGDGFVLVMYTWYGDTNLDGVVNQADLARFNPAGTTWTEGDLNYDGKVTPDDYALFSLGAANQNRSLAVVPEPTALTCLAAFPALLRRRRRPNR